MTYDLFFATTLFLFIALLLFVLILISMLFFGAPFDPSSNDSLRKMIKLAKIRKGDIIADLGSGNGKVVIAFAKLPKAKEVHGFEINPFLLLYSRKMIKKHNLDKKAFIHWKSFWNQNLSKFDVVTVFQIHYVMEKLGEKLKKELKKNARVVSNLWKFPNLKLKKSYGEVYLYKI